MNGILTDDIISKVKQENCFDFLRYLFAFSLIIAHFCTQTCQQQFWFITGSMRVKAFFTITGFLVSYSFLRRNSEVKSYVIKRIARIIPAYVVCILFCLLVGWYVTSLDTPAFLSSSQTLKYAISNLLMLNWIEPELPSTFQSNPLPEMNGSLWSMKQEVIFYFLVPILMWIMKVKGKKLVLPVILIFVAIYNFVPVQLQYFSYFFTGMTLLLFFDFFCNHTKYLLLMAVCMEAFVYCFDIPYLSSLCQSLEPITFGIIIIGVAYNCRFLNFLRRYDNVTYGLYLYHFPVIQCLIHYGVTGYSIKLAFLLAVIITSILACLSWFCIEKPLINRCKYLSR